MTTDIKALTAALDWKLLTGSHEFPGPQGGTCINEAAVVAAGFPYMKINGVDQMPPCFSRVIAQLALSLNDTMPHDQRQRLIPFVARLAGTADSREIEQKRCEYIVNSLINNVISAIMETINPAIAAQCRSAVTVEETKAAAVAAGAVVVAGAAGAAIAAVAAGVAGVAAATAARWSAAAKTPSQNWAWDWSLATLEGVLAIGNRADDLDAGLVRARLDAVRGRTEQVPEWR